MAEYTFTIELTYTIINMPGGKPVLQMLLKKKQYKCLFRYVFYSLWYTIPKYESKLKFIFCWY